MVDVGTERVVQSRTDILDLSNICGLARALFEYTMALDNRSHGSDSSAGLIGFFDGLLPELHPVIGFVLRPMMRQSFQNMSKCQTRQDTILFTKFLALLAVFFFEESYCGL